VAGDQVSTITMNKKIISSLIIILAIVGFAFLVVEKISKPEQPLEETISVLREEIRLVYEEVWLDEISQEKADEKLTALESRVAELITKYSLKSKVDELVAQRKTAEELAKWAEPRIRTIDLQLGGIAEYFAQKYRIDTGTEVGQVRALQNELREFSDEIWERKASREEIDEKLLDFENKTVEIITEYDIQAEVDEYAARIIAATDRVTAINQRISAIQLQLNALELYLSEEK